MGHDVRTPMRTLVVSIAAASLLVACGGDVTSNPGGGGGGSDPGTGGGGATGTGMPPPDGDWQPLVEGSWTLPSGQEDYWCARKTIDEDLYIRAFRAIAPLGTHHTLLTKTNGSQPDGEFPCSAGNLADDMIYASGVGTDPFGFPEGVAIKLEAGTQVLLNLHLFNTSISAIDGTSGTEVLTLPASEVEQEAEMIFAGTVAIFVGPQAEQTISGTCDFPVDATVATVWPHMHQYGTHMKVVHEADEGDVVLHDAPYDFNEQVNYPIDPVLVRAGERVRVFCSYQNTTDTTLTFGESSNDEMCFAGLYRYPALGTGVFCDLF